MRSKPINTQDNRYLKFIGNILQDVNNQCSAEKFTGENFDGAPAKCAPILERATNHAEYPCWHARKPAFRVFSFVSARRTRAYFARAAIIYRYTTHLIKILCSICI